jgi:hypothetical protein
MHPQKLPLLGVDCNSATRIVLGVKKARSLDITGLSGLVRIALDSLMVGGTGIEPVASTV